MPMRILSMLAVPDVEAACQYYADRFGFQCTGIMGNPPDYGIVERGGCAVHFLLSTADLTAARGAWHGDTRTSKGGLYIEVDDVDAIARELAGRGAAPFIAPETKPYGMRDFWLADLNGYIVAFGQRI